MSLVATSRIATGVLIQPLKQWGILKEKEIILTNVVWRVTIDLSEEVISVIHRDLHLVERQMKEFTSISEIRQIWTLHCDLHLKFYSFRQILPKPNIRPGLIILGGNV